MQNYYNLLAQYQEINSKHLFDRLKISKDIFTKYLVINKHYNSENAKSSFEFNYLNLFGIGEVIHSRIIRELLDTKSKHGQSNLFLKFFFLIVLNEENLVKKHWKITAEEGRVDILLKSNEDDVIIIENKSNNAYDQMNQLYRYWHQEVFLRYNQKFGAELLCTENFYQTGEGNKFKVVYLPSCSNKEPNLHSISKPDDITEPTCLPKEMPIKYELKSFQKHIVPWLENCLLQLPDTNCRLKEFIKMYIEICKNLY